MPPVIGERINSVDLSAVGALVAQIQRQPEQARTKWKSQVKWHEAFRSQSKSRTLAAVPSDEPASLGGSDTAPNPVEQLLGALGNCLAVGYAANAALAQIRIESLEIALEGDLDLHTFLGLGGDYAGFQNIRAKVDLKSDATPEQLKDLHRRVVATSPVGHTLSRPVPVEIELA